MVKVSIGTSQNIRICLARTLMAQSLVGLPLRLQQLLLQCTIQSQQNSEILEVNSYRQVINIIQEMSLCNCNTNRQVKLQLKF